MFFFLPVYRQAPHTKAALGRKGGCGLEVCYGSELLKARSDILPSSRAPMECGPDTAPSLGLLMLSSFPAHESSSFCCGPCYLSLTLFSRSFCNQNAGSAARGLQSAISKGEVRYKESDFLFQSFLRGRSTGFLLEATTLLLEHKAGTFKGKWHAGEEVYFCLFTGFQGARKFLWGVGVGV